MISDTDKNTIMNLSKQFGVGEVLLFGSGVDPDIPANDIDLGVRGIAPESFFDFYGALTLSLSKPVDLIDLSEKSRFAELINREGVSVYVHN